MSCLFLETASRLHSVHACAGKVEEFVAPESMSYKLEVWGASGGSGTGHAGKGGYSYGFLAYDKSDSVFVCVGAYPYSNGYTGNGGYNGGGSGQDPGGGASSICITNYGELKNYYTHQSDVLIVAGGGGGEERMEGGYGGGLIGGSSGTKDWSNVGFNVSVISQGGSQTKGGIGGLAGGYEGYEGSFGKGGDGIDVKGVFHDRGAGGGGGWYGGGGVAYFGGGGGGSGYIGTAVTNGQTIAGNKSFPSPTGGAETGHTGSGWAKISMR